MVGIDFQRASIAQREPVSLVQGQVEALLPALRGTQGVLGCVLLATCNRTELYLHTASPMNPRTVLTGALGLPDGVYAPLSVCRSGDAAITHLMEVASGMQSQIFGDDQILTQVKNAAATARKAGAIDSVLDTLFRHAVTAGKRVKTETKLVGVPASAAHSAVRRAAAFFGGDLTGKRAVVIGNGEMGRLAAGLLVKAGCQVTVTLRTYRHGQTIVPAGCDTHAYDDRCALLDGADLAVSATTSPHYTLTCAQAAQIPRLPRLLIDLAMPRDLDEGLAARPDTTVWNLDDLGTLCDENGADRVRARAIAAEERAEFQAWYAYRQALPLIAALKDAAFDRVQYDKRYAGLTEDGDLEGVAALAVNKTIDLLLGGMKEIVSAERLAACLAQIEKGSGK